MREYVKIDLNSTEGEREKERKKKEIFLSHF